MMNRLSFTIVTLLLYCGTSFAQNGLSFHKTAEGVEIREGGHKVLFYRTLPIPEQGPYRRGHYIHPLYDLDGDVLTEDAPEDHPHQHGLYWAWKVLTWDSGSANGWEREGVDWKVKKYRVSDRWKGGKIRLSSEVEWRATAGGDTTSIMKEHLSLDVYPEADNCRILDFEIRLKPLVKDLKIAGSPDKKGYGGFSPRLKDSEDIRFISEGGEVEAQITPVRAGPWMQFEMKPSPGGEGKPGGKRGVVLFAHPQNPGDKDLWILRDGRSMQNHVFPGREPFVMPSRPLVLKYRLVIYRESVDPESIYRAYVSE